MALYVPADTVWPLNSTKGISGSADEMVRYANKKANTTMMTLLK